MARDKIVKYISFILLSFLSCGDEKKALKTGKQLENLRIRICLQSCNLKFGVCLDKIQEDFLTSPFSQEEARNRINACSATFKGCT